MLARLPFALGPLEGHRLAIDVPALTLALGSLIRSDVLTAYPYRPDLDAGSGGGLTHPRARLACFRVPFRQPGDFHGPHVPAARPQFRSERLLPDRTNPRSKEPSAH